MKKLKSLYRIGISTLFSIFYATGAYSAGPSEATLAGTYHVTANVEISASVPEDVKDLFKSSFDFTLQPLDFSKNIYMAYIRGFITPSDLQFNYIQSSGKIEVQNYFTSPVSLGFAVDGTYVGRKAGSGSNFVFTVAADGTMSIPDFQVVTYDESKDVIKTVYATYTNVRVNSDDGGGEGGGGDDNTPKYPSGADISGWYKYTCTNFQLLNDDFAEYFIDEITFQIASNATAVVRFIFPSTYCEYDQQTGILSLNSLFSKDVDGTNSIGIAPNEGGWKGMAALTGNKMTFKIGEDGSITIPGFKVGLVSGNSFTPVASYDGGTVVTTQAPPPPPVTPKYDYSNFIGTYTFTGTMTNYAVSDAPISNEAGVETDYRLTFTINDYGQISEFNKTVIPAERIGVSSLTNSGELSDNNTVYTIDMDTYSGIVWNYGEVASDGSIVENTAYRILFGNFANTSEDSYDQGKPAFTLTKNDDDTYTLSDLSLVLSYSVSDESGNTNRLISPITTWTHMKFEKKETGTSGIIGIEDGDEVGRVRYFNLNGIEIQRPDKGVYIRVENGKAVKIKA